MTARTAALGWLIITLAACVSSATAQQASPLEALLTRLRLDDLRLHHLERSLDAAEQPKQPGLARRLADLYAEQMLAAADDAARFEQLRERVERLRALHPAASTPALEVVLLQAEYQRAESLVIRWLDEPTDRRPLAEAAEALGRIAPELIAHHRELASEAEEALKRVETLKADDAKAAAEQEAARLGAAASRAAYFAGWSSYYLGVAKQNPDLAKPEFAAAKQMFLTVLDVTDEDNYKPVEADGLALESVWRTRAAIGLGLAEIGLGQLAAGGTIFGWLEHASVPTELRDQAGYWHVQGLVNVGRYAEAAAIVDARAAAFTGAPSPGKNSLCIAALRAAAALPAEQSDLRRMLLEPGIRGLARLRQFDALDQLLAKYKLDDVVDPSSFYLTWLRGRRQFLAAEKSKSADEYQSAAQTLQSALDHPQAKSELTDAAQCRYYWAWCQYRLDRLETASAAFGDAVTALKGSLPDVAVQSAWMQCVILQQLAAKDKRQIGRAMTAMQTLIADFPKSEQAAKAEFALTRLRQASSTPEEAIASLAAVQPDDPHYLAALFELCQLRHQLWTKRKADAKRAAPLAAELLASVDRLLAAAPAGEHERRLRAALLAVDCLWQQAPSNLPRIEKYLAEVAVAANAVDAGNLAAAEYQYRRLQLAQKAGDQGAASEAAEWIVANAAGSPYELPALVIAARQADRGVEAASSQDRAARVADAAAIYSRLVERLGDSPAVLASTKNALAATAKLAEYDLESGRAKEAATRLARIVEALPNDKGYLRRAGLAHYAAGDYPAALDCWRRLLSGLSQGSDDWLEAKYHQIACLLQTDRPAAEKVWRQFKLLFPEVKSPAWRDKFAELASNFG